MLLNEKCGIRVMTHNQVIDVSDIVDDRNADWFSVTLVIWGFFITLIDGYDISAVAFAAPHLIKEWNISDRAVLGPVFAASLVGILLGAPLFGYLGDRFGRKITIVLSCIVFGCFTWLVVLANNPSQIGVLRFFAGLAIGGVMPNITALNAEFAPKRFRATTIIIMFSGVTLGAAIPGVITALLVPHYGWRIVFTIGGIAPAIVAICALIGMPESIKYLTVMGRQEEVLRMLRRMKPALVIAPDARFIVRDEKQRDGFSVKYLFADGLKYITPLLWLCAAVNLMGLYFLQSWMPTLLGSANIPVSQAALATSVFQVGGLIGGLAIARPLDTRGLAPVALLFAVTVPVVGAIGFVGLTSTTLLLFVVFFAGFCVLGVQLGLNAISAMIYPTSLRSAGCGWMLGIARIGSIAGPIVGGILIGMEVPVQQLYLLATVPFVVGACACIMLMRLRPMSETRSITPGSHRLLRLQTQDTIGEFENDMASRGINP
jgi:MFS transporter, AAHS family, 4-hydroxybenzoate transporter